MALVSFTDEPLATDTILLEITTPDGYGCLTDDPYRVDSLVVYFVERDFLGQNYGEYEKAVTDPDLTAALAAAQAALCADPTAENLAAVQQLLDEIDSKAQKTTFYYKDRVAVKTVGSAAFPAWLSTDADNAFLTRTGTATFTYEWLPEGSIREGDYFLCWTWTPLEAGAKLSAHTPFRVAGDPAAVQSIPTHKTAAGKYETLLERYLPDMYKQYISDGDQTPETLDNLNQSVAKGFTFVEDQANQVIDLFDANALHESLLPYLGNLFGLKLKSGDPTLWRRQIKEAVPLFKQKGTLPGLTAAFAQAGMTLNAVTQYWQIVSPYTWVESFEAADSATFTLSKPDIVLPLDPDNSGLWLKRAGEDDYTAVPTSYVSFGAAADGSPQMTWVADQLSGGGVDLFAGDFVKVMYQYREIPNPTAQSHEDYIRALPLADQRDENDQAFPLKNWNVRLIAEADPMFDVLVPVRHPFHDPLVFGWLRTEFAYSENIYNMDEYNGSTRPSNSPCDIGKEFLDPCGACLSSLYTADIGVAELSNDRMLEAQEILKEYTPFHARVHTLDFTGEVGEFVQPPTEGVEALISVDHLQRVISGNANPIYHRYRQDALTGAAILDREDLADKVTVLSGKLGTAYNDHVAFVAPDHDLQGLSLGETTHVLEVLAPSDNAGTYQIDDAAGHTARVKTAASEPVDEAAFTFNLSNVLYGNYYSDITQDDLVGLADPDADFAALGVKSNWDVAHTADYTGGPWTVTIPAYGGPYEVNDVRQGVLYLQGDGTLPTSAATGVTYTLRDDDGNVKATGTAGTLAVARRGYVELNDLALVDIENIIHAGDKLYYDGDEYDITEFDGNNFWVADYTGGDAAGVTVQTRRRLVEAGVGYFGYRGLRLKTWADHEAEFEMINGANPPAEADQTDDSRCKENFLFQIGSEFYKIVAIDGDEAVLDGRDQNWTTWAAGGTAVAYSVIHVSTKTVNVSFTVFDQIDRDGAAPVIREIFDQIDQTTAIVALSAPATGGPHEDVSQDEGITFTIQTRDGGIVEGEL